MKSFDTTLWIILVLQSSFVIDFHSVEVSAFTTTTTPVVVVSTLIRPSRHRPIKILPHRYSLLYDSRVAFPTTLVRMATSNHPHHSHSNTESNTHDDDSNSTPMMNSNEYIVAADGTRPTASSSSTTVAMGPTELLLLQRHQMCQEGLRQEYGCTIKNDPYDYIRSLIWFIFNISNIVFPTLGIILTIGLGLNLFCGLGYYYDTTSHTIIIDTLEHLRFQNQFLNSL